MYLVENRVFYTCGRISVIDQNIILKNIDKFENVELENCMYWFNRFNNSEIEYIKFTIKQRNGQEWYDFNVDNNIKENFSIEKFIIKIHKNGISSTEVFFRQKKNYQNKFDNVLNEFSINNTGKLFELVFRLNQILASMGIITFPKKYKYGTLLRDNNFSLTRLIPCYRGGNEVVLTDFIETIDESYLLRIHRVVENSGDYFSILDKYQDDNIMFTGCIIEANQNKYKGSLFWGFCLWEIEGSPERILDNFSEILDIDTYTMNEVVIYNSAGLAYTELIYNIEFSPKTDVNSTDLFEMYKANSYFLQKNKLNELSFCENVNNFVTSQREIEKFKMQEETFLNSERKFYDVYNALEANEKASANRIIQFVLTALTLLTIISVSKDILEFIKAEFLNEQHSTKIDFFTRTEMLSGIFILIILLFFLLRRIIRKM